MLPRLVHVAPMMGYTDRHFRYLLRLISKATWLYTEMIHANAILNGARDRFLAFHALEHPITVQLGGADPNALKQAAKICEDYGYDEINLNIGCPSPRVQQGAFGACLMKNPPLVADCIAAMQSTIKIPVTIKTRIGVDEYDSYDFLTQFVESIAQAGCQLFIIHARKAWLKGLSPAENRTIPPLNYEIVARLKKDFPSLAFILNGGVQDISAVTSLLTQFDGVMLGRAVVRNPYLLSTVDKMIYHVDAPIVSREQVMENYISYLESQPSGKNKYHILRHCLNLYKGMPNGKQWRKQLLGKQSGHPSAN